MENTGEIVIYQLDDEQIQIDVHLEKDSVWLTQEQIALMFQKDRTVITRHINNVFKEKELDEKSNVQKMHFPNSDKPTKLYNLDVIISVGYRVKSQRGTKFRIWANKILKDYLLSGYALNEKLLKEQNSKLNKLQCAIHLIKDISNSEFLTGDNKDSFLWLLDKYSSALDTLDDYDYARFQEIRGNKNNIYKLKYLDVIDIINKMKEKLGNSKYFGKQKDESLKSSISAIYQTFDGIDLYPSIEEKSANLLYFLVKNHSFVDGNKRIAAAVFLYFLEKNKILNGIVLENNFLVALTLMIANSNPSERALILNIVSAFLVNK